MDFFKKRTKTQHDVDDLDAGYDNEYYQGAYDRRDERDDRSDRYDDRRYDDRRNEDRRSDDRRSDDRRYDDRPDDRYDRYDDRYDDRSDRYDRRTWQEQDAPAYRERFEEKTEPAFEPAPAPEYLYFKPASYRDCREGIVRGLAAGHVVVVRLGGLEATDVLRLFDYMMGAVLALEGELVRPQATTVVLLPAGIELDDSELELDEDEDEDYEDEEYEEDYEDEAEEDIDEYEDADEAEYDDDDEEDTLQDAE